MRNNLVWLAVIIICSVILASGIYLGFRDSKLSSRSESPLVPADSSLPSSDSLAKRIQEKGFAGVQEVWQSLGIDPPEYLFQHADKSSYEIEQAYFSTNNGAKYRMLLITAVPFGWDWQYLLFRTSTPGKWAFLGKIDLGFQKYRR